MPTRTFWPTCRKAFSRRWSDRDDHRRKAGHGHRLLRRRHADCRVAGLYGGQGRRSHRLGDAVHHPGRFHRSRRSESVRQRGPHPEPRREMQLSGYLEGRSMANAFNMLRPNELIWSYVVNNYLKGIEPMAFDLLVWNSDSTRMPRANHSYYLRNCIWKTGWAGARWSRATRIDLSKVKIPIYISPPGKTTSPPRNRLFTARNCSAAKSLRARRLRPYRRRDQPAGAKLKYQYWTGPPPRGRVRGLGRQGGTEHPGSWWPDWARLGRRAAPEKVKARETRRQVQDFRRRARRICAGEGLA